MIPTGSRFLLGAFGAALVTLIIYMSVNWGALGTTGLVFLCVALAFLAGINLFARDSDVSAKDPTATTHSAAARRAPQASVWPFVGALGAVLVVVGLVTYPVVFIFGIAALVATVVEWLLEAWSERASADSRFNTGIRERLAHPYELPVLAALIGAVVVFSFSRIMLFLSKTGGPVAFGAVAAFVLVVGALVAVRPSLKSSTVQAVAGISILALLAGGVAASIAGERDIEPHETLSALASHGECGADETHADNNASETVGAKANLHGTVTLRDDGTLVASAEGFPGESDQLIITRSNPTNIRFINDGGRPARLVLEVGAPQADSTDSEPPSTEAASAGPSAPSQYCTALIEDGGSQFLTFELGQSTSEDHRVQFVVPGVDGQSVEVIVP